MSLSILRHNVNINIDKSQSLPLLHLWYRIQKVSLNQSTNLKLAMGTWQEMREKDIRLSILTGGDGQSLQYSKVGHWPWDNFYFNIIGAH